MAFCKYCGQENNENMKFCKNCGAQLETGQTAEPSGPQSSGEGGVCPSCGQPVRPGEKFCKGCGTKFEASPVTEPPEPPKASRRTCPYCGKSIPSKAKFCRFCGKKLDSDVPPSPSAPPKTAPSHGKAAAFTGAGRRQKSDPQDKAKKKFKITPVKVIALCLAVCLILLLLPFSKKNEGFHDYSNMDESFAYDEEPGVILGDPGKGGSGTIGVEGETVKLGDVSVNAGIYALDEEETITVEGLPTQTCENGDWKLQSYDVQIGDKHELDDFITVRIPYDPSMIAPGEKEEDCVSALWFNEETESWETMNAEVDTQTKEVVIFTDHLSIFGSSTICDAGKRQAYFRTVGMSLVGMHESPQVLDRNKSAAVLQDFVANGGKPAPNLVLEAAGSVISTALNISSETAFYADLISNPINIAGLGSPSFSPGLSKQLSGALGNVGMAASAINIASGFIQGDDASVLGAYKDTANLLIGAASEAGHLASNVGLAMSGVWVMDFTINHMNTFGHLWHMEKHEDAYGVYINERTPKKWREIMIELVKKYPSDSQALNAAINKEIEDYADDYWNKNNAEYMDDAGYGHFGTLSVVNSKDRAVLKEKMVQHLYAKLQPVAVSVKEYYQKQMQKELRRSVNKVFNLYNKHVLLKIYEVLEEGESPKYAGCKVQFGPLNEDGRKHIRNWTGTLNGDGETSTDCSILGYLLAGSPNEVRIYRRGDTPQTDEPIRVVPFVFTERVTEIPITHGQEEQKDEEDPNEQDDRDDSSEQATEPDEEKHGYWKRTGRSHCCFVPEEQYDSYQGSQGEHHSVHSCTASCTETSFNFHSHIDGNWWVAGMYNHGGAYQDIAVNFSEPAQSYKPGETVCVNMSTSVSEGGPEYYNEAWATCGAVILKTPFEDIVEHDCQGAWPGAQGLTDQDGNDPEYDREQNNTFTLYGKMPEGGPGQKVCIRYTAYVSSYVDASQAAGSVFEYEWVEEEEPEEKPKSGYWKQTGRQHFYCDPSDSKTAHQGDYASEWKMDSSASATEFTCSGSVEGNYWSGGTGRDEDNYSGSTFYIQASFSEPKSSYEPGEQVSVDIQNIVNMICGVPGEAVSLVSDGTIISHTSYEEIVKHNCFGKWPGSQGLVRNDGKDIWEDHIQSRNYTVCGYVPETGKPGDKICIRYNASAGPLGFSNQGFGSVWEYEWVE